MHGLLAREQYEQGGVPEHCGAGEQKIQASELTWGGYLAFTFL